MANTIALLFFLIPVAVTVGFVVSLVRYIFAKSKNRKSPETYSPLEMSARCSALIVTSILMGIIIIFIISIIVLLNMAIAYM